MQTILVEVLNKKAVRLLKDLEDLQLIKLIANPKRNTNQKVQKKLSAKAVKSLHSHIKKSRTEWDT